jgi:hypothetical protein
LRAEPAVNALRRREVEEERSKAEGVEEVEVEVEVGKVEGFVSDLSMSFGCLFVLFAPVG